MKVKILKRIFATAVITALIFGCLTINAFASTTLGSYTISNVLSGGFLEFARNPLNPTVPSTDLAYIDDWFIIDDGAGYYQLQWTRGGEFLIDDAGTPRMSTSPIPVGANDRWSLEQTSFLGSSWGVPDHYIIRSKSSGLMLSSPRVTMPTFVTLNLTTYSPSPGNESIWKIPNAHSRPLVVPVAASPGPAAYSSGTLITLSTSEVSNADIFYNENGASPFSFTPRRYTGPITLTSDIKINTVATGFEYNFSPPSFSTFDYHVSTTPLTPPTPTVTPPIPIVTPTPGTSPLTPGKTILRITMDKLQYTENGVQKMFDVAPYQDTREWRSMIPMRFIAEAFGAYVSWDDATKTQTISLSGKTFTITEGVQLPNGMGTATLIRDRFMVPLRYVSEQLGGHVDWDESTQTNTITY